MRIPPNHGLHMMRRRHQNHRSRDLPHRYHQILHVFKKTSSQKRKISCSLWKKTWRMIHISERTKNITNILKYSSKQSLSCNNTLFFNYACIHQSQSIWSLKFMSKHIFQAYTSVFLSPWCAHGSIGSILILESDFIFQVE